MSSLPLHVLTSKAYVLPMTTLLITLISRSFSKSQLARLDKETRSTIEVLEHGYRVDDVTPHYLPRCFPAPALEKHKVRETKRSLREVARSGE